MIKLIVSKPGLFLRIPNISPFRTPAEVDVTGKDLNMINSYLRNNGILDYKIISIQNNIIEEIKELKEKFEEEKEKISIGSRLLKIEQMLENLTDRKPEVIEKIVEKISLEKQNSSSKIIEKDNGFIPSIDLEGMAMSGSSTKTEESNNNNIEEKAKLLKKMTNKKTQSN